jgi:hypothetical protein
VSKPIDFEQRREALLHKRKDASADALKHALRQARESYPAGSVGQDAATRKLLDLYRKGKPRQP